MTDIDKMQKYLLATLDEFIRVCNKYNLEWFADGGTLLGAVRDGKMIPWDDDIDIVMPRNSYNKFITLSDEFKEAHNEILWSLMAGLRHRLVHDYDGTNWSIISDVVFDELPALIAAMQKLI